MKFSAVIIFKNLEMGEVIPDYLILKMSPYAVLIEAKLTAVLKIMYRNKERNLKIIYC